MEQMNDPDRPTIPEVEWLAAEYYALEGNVCWGNLHIVLDDFNVDDDSVRFCINAAREDGDVLGEILGHALLAMSPTQRRKLAGKRWPITCYRGETSDRRNDSWEKPENFDVPR